MVCVGQRLPVQRLQVGGQVVDPLGVQELADHVGRLQLPDGSGGGNTAGSGADQWQRMAWTWN